MAYFTQVDTGLSSTILYFSLSLAGACSYSARGNVHLSGFIKTVSQSTDQLKADIRFPDHPSYETYVDNLDSPHNFGSDYGMRLWSYFEGTITGAYRFAVACDDFCTLSLGGDKESAKEIIKFETWVDVYDWRR